MAAAACKHVQIPKSQHLLHAGAGRQCRGIQGMQLHPDVASTVSAQESGDVLWQA